MDVKIPDPELGYEPVMIVQDLIGRSAGYAGVITERAYIDAKFNDDGVCTDGRWRYKVGMAGSWFFAHALRVLSAEETDRIKPSPLILKPDMNNP